MRALKRWPKSIACLLSQVFSPRHPLPPILRPVLSHFLLLQAALWNWRLQASWRMKKRKIKETGTWRIWIPLLRRKKIREGDRDLLPRSEPSFSHCIQKIYVAGSFIFLILLLLSLFFVPEEEKGVEPSAWQRVCLNYYSLMYVSGFMFFWVVSFNKFSVLFFVLWLILSYDHCKPLLSFESRYTVKRSDDFCPRISCAFK